MIQIEPSQALKVHTSVPKEKGKKSEYAPFDWQALSIKPVVGIDEVGRGCLAGAVYAGAVVLRETPGLFGLLKRLTDSKLLSEKAREEIAELVRAEHHVSIASASVEEIESLNILKASLLAMKRAVEGLKLVSTAHLLIDGTFLIPGMPKAMVQTALIKGDLRAAPISAAAICAKVARDQKMKELSDVYPEYGFANHKAYGTKEHQAAIVKLGAIRGVHRATFKGVREYL